MGMKKKENNRVINAMKLGFSLRRISESCCYCPKPAIYSLSAGLWVVNRNLCEKHAIELLRKHDKKRGD